MTCWGKWHVVFKGTETLIRQQWKIYLYSAQVVVMKLNAYNSFIKQPHCVIVISRTAKKNKKPYSNSSSITFYTKRTLRKNVIYIHMYFLPVIPSSWWMSEYYIFSRLKIAGELKCTLWLYAAGTRTEMPTSHCNAPSKSILPLWQKFRCLSSAAISFWCSEYALVSYFPFLSLFKPIDTVRTLHNL